MMKILNKSDLNEAKDILLNDGIIAFPTETVYGLGVTYDKYDNYLKLVKAKNRPDDKPFTIMCASFDDVKDIIEFNDITKKIINKFTPGPITLILKTKKDIPNYLDLGTGFVGIRVPKDCLLYTSPSPRD